MQNLHIEHPEDSILSGDLSVLDWFREPGHLSVKMDGCPAIVWGKHPIYNQFFVGTKSVFNKIKHKINYSHEDIDQNHSGEIAEILHTTFDCLDHECYGVYQGDFIGFGGSDVYTPNTITYKFSETVSEKIIIAPHTVIHVHDKLSNAVPYSLTINYEEYFCKNSAKNNVKWVQPNANIVFNQECFEDVKDVVAFARQMATTVNFAVSELQENEIRKCINSYIRKGDTVCENEISFLTGCDLNLIRFWKLIKSIKDDCLSLCRNDGPEAYLNGERIDSEGYVYSNDINVYKLVNREVFSYHNFNSGKFSNA